VNIVNQNIFLNYATILQINAKFEEYIYDFPVLCFMLYYTESIHLYLQAAESERGGERN